MADEFVDSGPAQAQRVGDFVDFVSLALHYSSLNVAAKMREHRHTSVYVSVIQHTL